MIYSHNCITKAKITSIDKEKKAKKVEKVKKQHHSYYNSIIVIDKVFPYNSTLTIMLLLV